MDPTLQQHFIAQWRKYFNDAELPLAFYYTDTDPGLERPRPISGHRCVVADLNRVRRGTGLCFTVAETGCGGGRRYFGFQQEYDDTFPYFLSCGIPGKLEGERYKKTPELVRKIIKQRSDFVAPGSYIVFQRWDHLAADDTPEAVIFFAPPDVLSGLFTLANFDEAEPDGVIAPFGAGCGTIVQHPYTENHSGRPRAVLGMCDVSARPYVSPHELTLTVPFRKFVRMVDDMDESFLITASWRKVQKRVK